MMQMRTHTCGELRLANAGQRVKIVGWMENVRVVGQNFAFVVLRDFYGTTQVVVENQEMMDIINGLNKESTISVEGTVRERASKNPKQATGDVEVVPEKIEVLGRCRYNSLPFEINRSREADETQRLKYRYLDLRNPAVKSNIILRCQVVSALRAAMTQHGFLEITTPILTASSPEGARDYLVPARKHPGKFYALPQSPQQYKQLLMLAGFDRYFQIARCFRDEDLRADRQPEFTQIDLEMSFLDEEQIQTIVNATSFTALKDLLEAALDGGRAELVVRIGYWQADGRDRVAQTLEALRQSRGIPEETVWIVRYYPQTDPVGIIEFRLKPTEEEIAEEQAAQSAAEPEQTLAEEAPAAPDAGSETDGK